jgi:hypothetical protein
MVAKHPTIAKTVLIDQLHLPVKEDKQATYLCH